MPPEPFGRPRLNSLAKVFVAGEALVDLIPVGPGSFRAVPGGGPYNAARSMARLGISTTFLTRLSSDELGSIVANELRRDGVDLSFVSWGSEPTTLALVRLDPLGVASYNFYVEGTSAPQLTPLSIPDCLPSEYTALHMGTLGLVLEPMAATLTALALREAGHRLLMIDINVRPALVKRPEQYRTRISSLIPFATVVQASDADLQWLFPGANIFEAAQSLLDQGAGTVLVTLGASGALALHRGFFRTVPAPTITVVDTIGAGDSFGAAFLTWLARRSLIASNLTLSAEQLGDALEFAVRVASLTCTRAGADPPREEEL